MPAMGRIERRRTRRHAAAIAKRLLVVEARTRATTSGIASAYVVRSGATRVVTGCDGRGIRFVAACNDPEQSQSGEGAYGHRGSKTSRLRNHALG
jgi:hypothetical protein